MAILNFKTLSLLAIVSITTCFSLPPPIGPYKVGTISFPLTDASRLDPLAPDTRLRTLMLSAFYPTSNTTSHPLSPAYTNAYASYLETTYALPSNSASTIISRAHTSAPFLSNPHNCSTENTTSSTSFPTLLFSPGYTISRVEYTALLTSLASLGHLVLALDHPFDANFIDYPDGTIVLRRDPTTINWTSPDYVALRAADARFVISAFSQNQSVANLIPGMDGLIDEERVAMLGHSFGGATTADAMLRDERIKCGVDLDGIPFGPVVEAGLSRPFLIMGRSFGIGVWRRVGRRLRGGRRGGRGRLV